MKLLGWKGILALGGVGLVAVLLAEHQVAGAARAVGSAVNPMNPNNVINQGFNDVAATVAGQSPSQFSFGAWVYNVLHSDQGRPGGG